MAIMRRLLCIVLTAFCLSLSAYNDHRNVRCDSLEALLAGKHPPKGAELLGVYTDLMRGLLPYDAEKAVDYGHKAIALSYKLNDMSIRQYVLRHFGLISYGREDYDEALGYFDWALAVTDSMARSRRYTQLNIDDARSALYGSIANVYNMQGKAHLAIHYYQLALPIFEKYRWQESQAVLHYNLGELYYSMGNIESSEEHFLSTATLGESAGDSLMMAYGWKGLLGIYVQQGDYVKARDVATRCWAYYHAHRVEEAADYPVVLACLVRLHMLKGHEDLLSARTYAQEALSLADSLAFQSRSEVYAACSELFMVEGRWQQALDYALRSVHPDSLATSSDVGGYKQLAEIYAALGQEKKSREYIDKMYNTMLRFATEHYQSGLSQMEVIYETQKKEERIVALGKQHSLLQWLLGVTAVAALALVVIVVLLVVTHRRKRKLLTAQVAMATEAKERHLLARDLHDGLGGMLSLLRLKTERGEETLPLIDSIHTELRRTAHHLMPDELLRNGLCPALHDFALSVPGAEFQGVGDIALDKNRELVLYRCAYELVNNAIKHARAGRIVIQLMQERGQVMLTVSDDGKGMVPSAPGDLPKEGMGLQNIRERIAPYHGQLEIVSLNERGTDINITLPL